MARLRIVPLGGLGRIGGNMMAYETEDDLIVVDCGINFPGEAEPGVRYVLPDVTYVRERRHKLRGYIITHGHEDHIGALPYILPECPAPIWATAFTTALLETKLAEHPLVEPKLHRMADDRPFELGTSRVQPIPVTHSVPGAVMLALHTPAGVIVHTGDFKLDPAPPDGRRTNLAALEALGDAGVTLLLSDSTNAEKSGHTWSEREVALALAPLIAAAEERVIVTTFASNLFRLQAVIEASIAAGRKVLPAGRSVAQIIQMSREKGFLRIPGDVIVDAEHFDSLARRDVTVIASGCQGEPQSALSRIAGGTHPFVRAEAGDTLIMSSRRIPGNERAVGAVVNQMLRRGVKIIDDRQARVHTSGHAMQDEQQKILELVRPRFFVPLHGEYRHMLRHTELARACGVPAERIFLLEDGQPLELERHASGVAAQRAEPVPVGHVYVDGLGVGDVNDIVLRDRQILSESGFVSCIVTVDDNGRVVGRPQLLTRGVVHVDASEELLSRCADEVEDAVHELSADADESQRAEAVRAALRRFFRRELARRPLLLPVVLSWNGDAYADTEG